MLSGKDGVVEYATVKKKNKRKIKAKYFILAKLGGIENSRLLLWIRKQNENLLDNKLPIGKFWMDHPYHSVANGILFNEKFHNYLKKSEIEKFFDTNCENSFFLSPNKKFLKKIRPIKYINKYWNKTIR